LVLTGEETINSFFYPEQSANPNNVASNLTLHQFYLGYRTQDYQAPTMQFDFPVNDLEIILEIPSAHRNFGYLFQVPPELINQLHLAPDVEEGMFDLEHAAAAGAAIFVFCRHPN